MLRSFLETLVSTTQKCQPHKMVKHITEELFECVWPFCGVGVQRVKAGRNIFNRIWTRNGEARI